jgi:4-hydroxybenzoate polyprenyltransferase
VAAFIRLVHPFPSLLDGVVVAAVAAAAGASPARALGLGLSMTALQMSIGALNDIHDAPDDAGHKPGKPIPAGLVSVPAAWTVVVAGAALGVAVGALADVRIGALAIVVLLIGYSYDLVAKGTPWSWLPFAVGIPLLPVYGWLGAAGALPSFFVALVPMAVLAGAALAIANARADLERDVATTTVSIATRLGVEGSWRLHAALWSVTLIVALAWLVFRGVGLAQIAPVVAAAGLIGAAVAWSRDSGPAGRERAWQFEAAGGALALLAWLAAAVR